MLAHATIDLDHPFLNDLIYAEELFRLSHFVPYLFSCVTERSEAKHGSLISFSFRLFIIFLGLSLHMPQSPNALVNLLDDVT
jgi:hypothetical protein